MNHLELGLIESTAAEPSNFEKWAAAVETKIGHDLDGDQDTDGYSIDGAVMMFNAGFTVDQAVRGIK